MNQESLTQIPSASEPQILKHSWGFWGLLSAAGVYLWIVGWLIAVLASSRSGIEGTVIVVAVAGYLILSIFVAALIFEHDRRLIREAQTFKRFHPMEALGRVASDFQYVFSCRDQNVLREVIEQMDLDITSNLGWDRYQIMKFTDRDRRLIQHDARSFLVWRGGKTRRSGSVFLVARASQKGSICSLQWWLLFAGVIDNGAVRVFLAFAPFTMPLWIIPWLRGRHNVATGLRQLYGSFYESMDILTSAKSTQKICLDSLITVLTKHGIDVSDLKEQVAQVMNISISGGQNTFGNVVQGAKNVVAAAQSKGGHSA